MKQTIRAIGLASLILWLIVIIFTATLVYSAFQIGVVFGEMQMSTSEGTATLSLPFSIDNKGFYDISDLNITTILLDGNGASVLNSSTIVPLISSGNEVDTMHNISISLDQVESNSLYYLLFNDTTLNVNESLALKYAHVIWLRVFTNFTIPWGAPLHNLTIGEVSVNAHNTTHVKAILPFGFQNHSFFNLTGTMRVEIVNTLNQQVGAGTTNMDAPSHSSCETQMEVLVPLVYGGFKEARLYFDTSVFSYGPMVMPIG